MANQEHLDIIKQGVVVWNKWRQEYPDIQPDLSGADFSEADLSGAILSGAILMETNLRRANLRKANLRRADLSGAFTRESLLRHADIDGHNLYLKDLYQANLSEADLQQVDFSYAFLRGVFFIGANISGANFSRADLAMAKFSGANLTGSIFREADMRGTILNEANLYRADLSNTNLKRADLSGADLREADLIWSDLNWANLTGANLERADLKRTDLSRANLEKVNLTGCSIHGISAWNVQLKDAIQSNLVITDDDEPTITVDNLEVAQFTYLLLNNKKIRDVIDTITSKVVLILGRFTSERKSILEALRENLRKRDYLPILFDFDKPASRDFTETISTLAHLARFVIADITDAKSIPQELMSIVPNLPSVPVQPLILNSQHEYGIFEHFTRYSWVLPVYRYTDEASLLKALKENVIVPAEQKVKELEKRQIRS